MNRIIFTVFFSVFTMLASYAQENFKILGKVFPEFDGKSILLISFDANNQIEKVRATTIVGGKFQFEGEISIERFSNLIISEYPIPLNHNNEFSVYCDVFLESGTIFVEQQADSITVAFGTPTNDKNLNFNKLNSIPEKIEFVKKNTDNIVGREAFANIVYQLSDMELNDILVEADESFLNDELIDRHIASREIIKQIKQEDKKRDQLVGSKYADFELFTTSKETKKISDFVGKSNYVILDFWASWCGPCIKGMPHLKMLSEQYKDKGIEIVGISLDTKEFEKAWINAVKRINMPWVQVSNLDSEGAHSALANFYAVSDIPYAVIINKEGIVVDCVRFPVKYLEEALQRLP